MEILKVHPRRDGVKYCIIPKASEIQTGDRILVSNNLRLINKFMEEEDDGRKKGRKN